MQRGNAPTVENWALSCLCAADVMESHTAMKFVRRGTGASMRTTVTKATKAD